MYRLSENASAILARKEDNWEYFLAFEILEPELERLSGQYFDLRNCPPIAGTVLGRDESIGFCEKRFSELQECLPKLADLMNVRLPEAQGSLGEPGDAEAIIETCRQIVAICDVLFDWEKSLHTTVLHRDCDEFSWKASGMTEGFLDEIRRVFGEMREAVENSAGPPAEEKVMNFPGTFDTSPLDSIRLGTSGATKGANRSHSCVSGCLPVIGSIIVGGYFFGLLGVLFGPWILLLVDYLGLKIIDICPLAWWQATEKFLDFVRGALVLICILVVLRIAWVVWTAPPAARSDQAAVSASATAQPTTTPTSTPTPISNRRKTRGHTPTPNQGLDFGPAAGAVMPRIF